MKMGLQTRVGIIPLHLSTLSTYSTTKTVEFGREFTYSKFTIVVFRALHVTYAHSEHVLNWRDQVPSTLGFPHACLIPSRIAAAQEGFEN